MRSGLLWFDSDPQRGLAAKIQAAAQRYREKFGVTPDTCYVNRTTLEKGVVSLQELGVRVVPSTNVLVHHFFIGVADDDRTS